MNFRIEIEPYQGLEAMDPEDTTTSEAIETVYRWGPAVHMHFGPQIWATLSISGEVSDIYNDIRYMLKSLALGRYPFERAFHRPVIKPIHHAQGIEVFAAFDLKLGQGQAQQGFSRALGKFHRNDPKSRQGAILQRIAAVEHT